MASFKQILKRLHELISADDVVYGLLACIFVKFAHSNEVGEQLKLKSTLIGRVITIDIGLFSTTLKEQLILQTFHNSVQTVFECRRILNQPKLEFQQICDTVTIRLYSIWYICEVCKHQRPPPTSTLTTKTRTHHHWCGWTGLVPYQVLVIKVIVSE